MNINLSSCSNVIACIFVVVLWELAPLEPNQILLGFQATNNYGNAFFVCDNES